MDDDLWKLAAEQSGLSDDELYRRIAEAVVVGATPLGEGERKFLGKAWFDAQTERVRAKVCGSSMVNQRHEAGSVASILALAEVLSSDPVIGRTSVAIAIAVLMLRIGLDRVCGHQPDD